MINCIVKIDSGTPGELELKGTTLALLTANTKNDTSPRVGRVGSKSDTSAPSAKVGSTVPEPEFIGERHIRVFIFVLVINVVGKITKKLNYLWKEAFN